MCVEQTTRSAESPAYPKRRPAITRTKDCRTAGWVKGGLVRSRRTSTAFAVLCASVLLSASSCLDDIGRGGSVLAKSQGDEAVGIGVQRADDILVRVPETVGPTLCTRLRSSATELSDDPEVQDALEGLAWETTCALAFDEVPATVEEIAILLVERAVDFGISFLEEGEQEMADLVLDAFEEQENEAEDACNEVRQ